MPPSRCSSRVRPLRASQTRAARTAAPTRTAMTTATIEPTDGTRLVGRSPRKVEGRPEPPLSLRGLARPALRRGARVGRCARRRGRGRAGGRSLFRLLAEQLVEPGLYSHRVRLLLSSCTSGATPSITGNAAEWKGPKKMPDPTGQKADRI